MIKGMNKYIKTGLLLGLVLPGFASVLAQPMPHRSDAVPTAAPAAEQVLSLPDEDFDLAKAVLTLSREASEIILGKSFSVDEYAQRIDRMAAVIEPELRGQQTPGQIIKTINWHYFSRWRFTVDASDSNGQNPENLFLHTVLDRKIGYCLSLSIPYLCLGERLNLPLYGVPAPGHFFVRYDDGATQINIETTSDGAFVEDRFYAEKYHLLRPDPFYLHNLTKKQVLAIFLNNLGNLYNRSGNPIKAMHALEVAVDLIPGYPEAHTNLGSAYLENGFDDLALEHQRKAVALNPQLAGAWVNLGSALFAKNEFEEAIAANSKALEIEPDLTNAHVNIARIHYELHNYQSALQSLQRAEVLRPHSAESLTLLGNVYRGLGNNQEAIAAYKKAIQRNPEDTSPRVNLGHIYTELALYNKAITAYQSVLEIKPDFAEVLTNLGNLYRIKKRYSESIQVLEKAIVLNPQSAVAHYNLGLLYNLTGEMPERAIAAYQNALENDPDLPEAHHNLGVLYHQKMGDLERAIWHYKQAVALKPQLHEAFLNLGIAYFTKGDYDAAITALKRATRLQPISKQRITIWRLPMARRAWCKTKWLPTKKC